MDISIVHSIWTVVVLLIFTGILIWAYSNKHRQEFEDAGNIPLEEDDSPPTTKVSGENHHG